ncbi:MAG: alpha/beta fold hydrolase [Planctomycetaceae bacterium]|nr:MAG: alpha/beta fold hydrolase [Planctomycetaceae bacterium]
MAVELVRATTADGLRLDGAFAAPSGPQLLPLDSCLFLHGTGSNFYAPGVLEAFADSARTSGLATLRVNTRGHDGVCSLAARSGSIRGGATFEKVCDCAHDVTAWLDWLTARGCARVALVGHSIGGVKAVYSQAYAPHASVAAVVGISPPRFHHAWFQKHPQSERFRADFARAQELVAAGSGDALLTVTQPMPYITTASGYLEKYGPEDKYDFVPLLSRLTCSTLIMIGSRSEEANPAFDQTLAAVAGMASALPHVTACRIDGADINYRGQLDAPFQRLRAWEVWSTPGTGRTVSQRTRFDDTPES